MRPTGRVALLHFVFFDPLLHLSPLGFTKDMVILREAYFKALQYIKDELKTVGTIKPPG